MRAFKDTAHYTDGNETVSGYVRMCVTYIQLFLYFSIGVFFLRPDGEEDRERERVKENEKMGTIWRN